MVLMLQSIQLGQWNTVSLQCFNPRWSAVVLVMCFLAFGLPLVQTWWYRRDPDSEGCIGARDHSWWEEWPSGMTLGHRTRESGHRTSLIIAHFDSNPPWVSPAWNMPDGMALLCASPWFLIGILLLTSKFYEALVTHGLHNSIFEALCWMGVHHFVLSGSNSILIFL